MLGSMCDIDSQEVHSKPLALRRREEESRERRVCIIDHSIVS